VQDGFELKIKIACQALVHQLQWLRRAVPHSLKVCHDCLSKTRKVGNTTVGLNDEEDSGPLIDAGYPQIIRQGTESTMKISSLTAGPNC